MDGDRASDALFGGKAGAWTSKSAIEILRIGLGLVWLVNLVFILDPANHYWSSFSTTARSFAPTTIGGPGLADYVATHPQFFAWGIAIITGYLAVGLLLGFTTRIACFLGSFFSAMLLATQFGTTFLFPGGTDVGAHPLYILSYAVLVLGGAGQSHSVDLWLRHVLATRRAARLVRGTPTRRPAAYGTSIRTMFTFFVAGTLLSFGIGFGLIVAFPVPPASGSTPPVGPVHYVNLTVSLNSSNGWPQYSPANFSVPTGRAVFTIVDRDAPMSWSGCPCPVGGTVGGVELLNGTPVGRVSGTNVAHTFNVFPLGLQILSPGGSTVQFTVDFARAGVYTWFCLAPCGTGANPYNTPPMGTPGYMTGTMTVT